MEPLKRIVGSDAISLPDWINFGELTAAVSQSHGVTFLERAHQRRVFERNSVVEIVFTAEA
jgi:hypothetical protein